MILQILGVEKAPIQNPFPKVHPYPNVTGVGDTKKPLSMKTSNSNMNMSGMERLWVQEKKLSKLITTETKQSLNPKVWNLLTIVETIKQESNPSEISFTDSVEVSEQVRETPNPIEEQKFISPPYENPALQENSHEPITFTFDFRDPETSKNLQTSGKSRSYKLKPPKRSKRRVLTTRFSGNSTEAYSSQPSV